ncbi:kinase-like protein [Exidia glandulosa HHB12029]|uniref:Kinase-like protein n=1 Tax=Exidia glandulosa HHB12029 TaxID=1314781 RepID=A0A165KH49_EXIGL|nr:kinase-like protein [Exidia glandulosa HHB12029]
MGSIDTGILRRYNREIALWRRIQHPNILPLSGLCSGLSGLPAMISPWCQNGDIVVYLRNRQHLPIISELKIELIAQICAGLAYLHENDIVHGDLKGANILISDDGAARVADFGFSNIMAGHSVAFSLHTSTMGGTYRWMWPALLTDSAHPCFQSDVWALGCVLLEVQSGRVPYHDIASEQAVIVAMSRHDYPTRPWGFPDMLWHIILACWNDADSPSVADVGTMIQSWRRLRETARRKIVHPVSPIRKIGSVAILGAAQRVFTTSERQVSIWNVTRGRDTPLRQKSPMQKNGTILAIAVCRDGQFIATASSKELRVWNVSTGEPAIAYSARECGKPSLTLAFSTTTHGRGRGRRISRKRSRSSDRRGWRVQRRKVLWISLLPARCRIVT